MRFIKFIFSDFWYWLGFVVILSIIIEGIKDILKTLME